ncbi:unnamed protein product [Urochloa decumbens]|uniref:Uncharacterized protein n=1 Tax=Urochloa decumbens TaxID=240449 RepID=A0ABC8ZA66_9POAL
MATMSELRSGRLAAAAAAVVLLATMISMGTEATPIRKMGNELLRFGSPIPIIPTDPMPPPPRTPSRHRQATDSPPGHEINKQGGMAAPEAAPSGVSEALSVVLGAEPN